MNEFEQHVNTHLADLRRYAVWLCGDRHVAEDLVQETLLRAWRSQGQLRDFRAFKGWLITTLRREHARLYERKRLERVETEPDALIDGALLEQQHLVDRDLLRQHIEALPQHYREPLVLQALLGYSVAEIATILELPPSTIMTRLFRARHKLLTALAPKGATS